MIRVSSGNDKARPLNIISSIMFPLAYPTVGPQPIVTLSVVGLILVASVSDALSIQSMYILTLDPFPTTQIKCHCPSAIVWDVLMELLLPFDCKDQKYKLLSVYRANVQWYPFVEDHELLFECLAISV